MGEVFLARDTSVGRHVAIKLLPESLVNDEARLQRLRREARVLAALNHPNIAALYAFEEGQGPPFLVLEYVDGETLAVRLRRGRMRLHAALLIAVDVAKALGAVHERGVVHRDLKPSNIMLTPQEDVKLLDFGVARQDRVEAEAEAETRTRDFETTRGRVIGTPAYMSPEQAQGLPADQQTDIWAFGCVLFELVTGDHPFPASRHPDQVAAILERDPDWRTLAPLPVKLQDLLKRCLQKEPDRRLHDIRDARIQIDEVLAEVSAAAPPIRRARPWMIGFAAVAVVTALGFGIRQYWGREPASPERVQRFAIDLGSNLAFGIDYPAAVAISSQSDLLAYVADSSAGRRIYTRAIDELQPRPIVGTDGAQLPFFSPDGRWLGFFADGRLKKVSVRGGAPVVLAAAPDGMGGAWSAEGWIVFAPSSDSGLRRIPESGGRDEVFSGIDRAAGEQAHVHPVLLEDQRTVLFTVNTGGRKTDSRLAIQKAPEREHRIVLEGGSHGQFLPPRWLIYARGRELLAAEFDAPRGRVIGTPFRVLDGVQDTPGPGVPVFALSTQGTLVYAPEVTPEHVGRLVWLDRSGNVAEAIESGHAYYRPRLSPDGARIAYHFADPDLNVWVRDVSRGTRTKLTKDPASDAFGVWSPDGLRIAFSSARDGPRTLFVQAADGSGSAERLLPPGNPRWPTSWSPDGHWLAFFEEDAETGMDIWLLDMRDRQPRPFLRTRAREAWARFSPDGKWLAYYSSESGVPEIYLCSMANPSQRTQVSAGGGTVPIWSPTNNEIYYNRGTQFMAVPVRMTSPPSIGRAHALFDIDLFEVNDKSAQADRFLAVDAMRAATINRLAVVLGWPQVVSRLANTR